MTEQEAKGFIQGKLDCMNSCEVFDCKGTDECDNCNYCYAQGNFGEQKKAFEMGINALEKQIAKKPELIEGKMWTCPCCDNHLMHKWLKYPTELMPLSEGLPYCLSCGQKILWDWGNEDAE